MGNDAGSPPPSEGMLTRRNLLMGGAMLAVSATAYARKPQPNVPPLPKDSLEKDIPLKIGDWSFQTKSGLVMPAPDELSAMLYKEILTRVYVSPVRPPVALLIAYSNIQNGLLQLHRPETCYPASGYHLTQTVTGPMETRPGSSIPVRTFAAADTGSVETVLYWTRIGEDLPTNWMDQRVAVAKANLRGVVPDGILVRTSLLAGEDKPEAVAVLSEFVREMLGAVTPKTRHLLAGSA